MILGVILWLACIYWLFFSDAYYRSKSDWNMLYDNQDYSSSSSSSSSVCETKSEDKFRSCMKNIPGTASEADMNYCSDLHQARMLRCR